MNRLLSNNTIRRLTSFISISLIIGELLINPVNLTLAQEATQSAAQQSVATEEAKITPTAIVTPTGTPIPLPSITTEPTKTPDVPQGLAQPSEGGASARMRRKARFKKLAKASYQVNENIKIPVLDTTTDGIKVELIDSTGAKLPVDLLKKDSETQSEIQVIPPKQFKPGKYTLKITDWTGAVDKKDFSWGVLTINMNKSIYGPNEKAIIFFGVLDDTGETICDAHLTMDITDPQGVKKTLATDDGSIHTRASCGSKNTTVLPDYDTFYKTSQVGVYNVHLIAITKNGMHEITDSFEVKTNAPFDVERFAPTRIYPPVPYPVRLDIIAKEDFKGDIEEIVPDGFRIVPSEQGKGKSYDRIITTTPGTEQQDVLGVYTDRLGLPFSGDHKMTLGFGEHPDDVELDTDYKQFGLSGHDGIDFDMPEGTPILAVDAGKAEDPDSHNSYGKTIVLDHAWGKSYYGHLSKIEVKTGTEVKRGDIIGYSGSTGLATGPHLHFAVQPNKPKTENGFYGKVDPLPYLGLPESHVLGLSTSVNALKHIIWNVDLKKGQMISLGYTFDAPDISPELFLLGPLTFRDQSNANIFQERRQWQIASDAPTAYQFTPVSGNLVLGYEQDVQATTAATGEGVNTGSWKGTLADDNLHWVVGSTTTGIDVQLNVGGVSATGTNTMIVQTEFDLDATAPNMMVQICDWVSSTSVDNAADAMCTGGGWRTLNNRKVAITTATATAYQWNVYNGYWSNGSNTAINTPLTNFVNGANLVKVRYFASNNTTSLVSIDYLRIYTQINPLYTPSSITNLGSGALLGDYTNATVVTQGASDNTYSGAAGTAGSVADFYHSFTNVQTYSGMNTILVRAEYSSSSNAGATYRPKIYNFTTPGWEDLSTATINASTTDATNMFAKNNITISNYVSNGEIRIGWRALSNSTAQIRIDQEYIMVGTTNSNTSDCEISFGSVSANTCSNTRDIDTAGTTNTWNINTEDESTNRGTGVALSYYPSDTDADAVVEEAAASHVKFAVTMPSDAYVTSIYFAARYLSGTAGTVQLGLYDYSGTNNATGGFTAFGATATTAQVYTDNMTVGGVGNGGMAGIIQNPDNYIDQVNNQMWMRLRTTADGATTNNSINLFDFAFVAPAWIVNADHPTKSFQFAPTGETLVTGTDQAITSATAASNEGVNTGSWKGTLATDNFHWAVASTASGIDMQLNIGNVALNNANMMMIQTTFDLDATAPNTLVQICDWVTSTSVDNAADAQCTTGGWRTLNNTKTAITTVTPTSYHWQIYNGYWTNGSNTAISTPLTNFVNSGSVKIRYFSSTNTTSVVSVDSLHIFAVVNPVYAAGGFTNLGVGTVTGDYMNTNNITQGASDNAYLQIAGTAGTVADFYLSFKNVRTYPGANTIVMRAEYSCSNTGPTYRPKIYNFNASTWEDLTTTSIACSTTDATNIFATNNITLSNYVSSGEIRVGFRGLSNSTVALRVDLMYIMIGTTNTDLSRCEISFGSLNANDCSATRTIDTTATTSSWDSKAESESISNTVFPHDYYALDGDNDTTNEDATSSNITFAAVPPSNSAITSEFYAARFLSGTAGTVQLNLRDYSGFIATNGGWTSVGAATATTTQVYTDNITVGGVGSGGPMGFASNAQNHIDKINGIMNLKLRTSASGTVGTGQITQWDFAMVSIQWIETSTTSTITIEESSYRLYQNTNSIIAGSPITDLNVPAALNSTGTPFRLRLLLHIGTADLASSGQDFKLQFARKGSGSCANPQYDYANVTSTSEIAYYDNASPTDGSALTTTSNDPTHSGDTIVAQTYDESSPFTNSQGSIVAGRDGLWDFPLYDNGAPPNTNYCMRALRNDGAVFDTYTVYPEFSTYNSKIGMPQLEQKATLFTISGTTIAPIMPKAVTTGNLIVVAVSKWDSAGTNSITGVTDNKGNVYTLAVSQPSPFSGSTQQAIYYAQNVTGGSNFTVTTTISGSANKITTDIYEYSGIKTVGALDKTATASTASTATPSTGSTAYTSQDRELVFAVFSPTANVANPIAGTGYTLQNYMLNTTGMPLITEDKVVTAAGTQTATISVNASTTFFASIATFKAANTGPTNDKLLKHGKWYSIDGVKQSATF